MFGKLRESHSVGYILEVLNGRPSVSTPRCMPTDTHTRFLSSGYAKEGMREAREEHCEQWFLR